MSGTAPAASTHVATLQSIVPWLDDLLQVATTPDYSGAMNGLQFEHVGPVTRVAAAVDASLRSITDAVDAVATWCSR